LYDDANEALEFKGPLYREGRLHVVGDGLLRAINEVAVPRISSRDVYSILRSAGFTRTVVRPTGQSDLKSLRYWRDDAGVAREVVNNWYADLKATVSATTPKREE
jgi:hypothetical protein